MLDNLEALVPGFEPFNNEGRLKFGSLKGTTQLTPNHHFQVTYQRDANVEETNFQVNGANIQITALGGATYGTRLSSVWGDRIRQRSSLATTTSRTTRASTLHRASGQRAVATGAQLRRSFRPGAAPGPDVSRCSTISTPARSDPRRKPRSAPTSGTSDRPDGGAPTRFRQACTSATTARFDDTFYSNDGFALEEVALLNPGDAAAGVVPFHRRYYGVASIDTSRLAARDNTVYVQDSWKPGARLTINAGLRVDFLKATDELFDLETLNDVAIGPRIGGNYSITADNKNLVRASFGRVGDVPNASYIGGAGTSVADISDEYDNDLDGTFESVFVSQGRAGSQNRRSIPIGDGRGSTRCWWDTVVSFPAG